jgi:replication factor A2
MTGAAKANDYAGGAAAGAVSSSDYAHLPALQRKVMEIVAAEEHEDGLHVSTVSRHCGNAPPDQVM